MTTSILTRQQQAVAALVQILAMPGLPEATWTIYPGRLSSDLPELAAHVPGRGIEDARAAIDAYALALGLHFEDEKHLTGDTCCADFTKIEANGVIDGVRVKVWCPARDGGASC